MRIPGFDLKNTLESGQFFLWSKAGDGYRIRARGREFEARQAGSTIDVRKSDEALARSFFDGGRDYAPVERALRRDPILRRAMDAVPGVRLLRQDPYECMIGFIVSICSNIPRITANVRSIARVYGRGGLLPDPSVAFEERILRRLGLGFRARYLVGAQKSAALLRGIEKQSDDDARRTLMRIDGIAEKVADCILLFAYGRWGVFPVDTWIRKTIRRLYFDGRPLTDREIRAWALERFGAQAGLAQQYLYAWSRAHLKSRPVDASRALP